VVGFADLGKEKPFSGGGVNGAGKIVKLADQLPTLLGNRPRTLGASGDHWDVLRKRLFLLGTLRCRWIDVIVAIFEQKGVKGRFDYVDRPQAGYLPTRFYIGGNNGFVPCGTICLLKMAFSDNRKGIKLGQMGYFLPIVVFEG
jgi:hypothetical protein